jgi:acyl-[acyl-carrier-protein]-phospholipid O-acyltransferase / long-chain-fatty-acid--[acyl-carrier-protein] ligase
MVSTEQYIVDNGFEEYGLRPELDCHIAALAFRSLAVKPFEPLIVDRSSDRKEMTAGMFLAAAVAISRRFAKIPNHRIGIVFPSGIPCALTNLAIALADKVSVNLNFTAGRKALQASIEKAGLTHIVTAKPMMDKLPDFPWTGDVVDFAGLMKGISKTEILYWYGLIVSTPASLLMSWLGVPKTGGVREAALLFSSGSTGEPKGVVLSHRNIIGNCIQIRDINLFTAKDVVLADLPIFHSFGFTVTMWYELLSRTKLVCLPNPLETRRVAQAISEEKATVLLGTPTLLRPFFKKVEPGLLKSLRLTIAGAEKTPSGFREMWEKSFGGRFSPGYGLTETAPVVAVNAYAFERPGQECDAASVGRLFPGMQACIVDDATGEVQDPRKLGILYLRGVNVFRGYLGNLDATASAFTGVWFKTGDLARFDDDGNLYIEGRISRFSKIGGEMVPHGTVELAIVQAYGIEDSEVPLVAVTGAEDNAKGESLVLFTAFDIDASVLREKLMAEGIPNLWIPRRIRRVDVIPCLASGKLDLTMLRDNAQRAIDSEEEAV